MSTLNKYAPYNDIDKNGVIIVTPFDVVTSRDPAEMIFFNISDHYTDKGLPDVDPDKSITFDFQNLTGKSFTVEDMDFIVSHFDKLYTGEIHSLCLRNTPQLSYSVLAGFDITEEGALQWERADFEKIIAHLRMLYDGNLTKQ